MRKPALAYAKTQGQISCLVTAQLISTFVFLTNIVQSLYFLNPKCEASSHLLLLYNPVCVGRKPQRQVVSRRSSFTSLELVCLVSKVATNTLMFKLADGVMPQKDAVVSHCFDTSLLIPVCNVYMSLVVRKTVFGVSDQVRHKSACTATEDG